MYSEVTKTVGKFVLMYYVNEMMENDIDGWVEFYCHIVQNIHWLPHGIEFRLYGSSYTLDIT
jgi:hypothetical protein